MKLGLSKYAEEQKLDSQNAAMVQSMGDFGLAKHKAKSENSDDKEDEKMLAEQTKPSGENTLDKKASLGIRKYQ